MMVNPRGLNICPDSPSIVARGTYTTTVVMVEPITALTTIRVPSYAASLNERPAWWRLKHISITTTALSVIIPIAIIRAAMVTTSKAKPARFIHMIVAMMEIGMVEPTISEPFISPKNTNMMNMARKIASTMVFATPLRVLRMVSAASSTTSIFSSGYFALRSSSTGITFLESVTEEPDCFLLRPTLTSSFPLYLESEVLSDTAYFTLAMSFR